jgi:hypothetical protein
MLVTAGHIAVQGIGRARATLVDQDDISLVSDPGVHPPAGCKRCTLSGATCEGEQRVGARCFAKCGQHHDVQLDGATGGRLSVLVNRVSTAARFLLGAGDHARLESEWCLCPLGKAIGWTG